MMDPPLPNACDSAEAHAYWLEWRTLSETNQYASFSDHLNAIDISGSRDAADEDANGTDLDIGDELVNVISELSDRERACGAAYPFDVQEHGIQYCPEKDTATYRFLMLLSFFGKDAGPSGTYGDRVFEQLCGAATHAYLGGDDNDAQAEVFGSPRIDLAKGFEAALNQLCLLLGEGGGYRPQPKKRRISERTSKTRRSRTDAKDAQLDIVAWRRFSDGRPGKLILFGQCATGQDAPTSSKLTELYDTAKWCEQWMLAPPLVTPLRAFYVPHTIEHHRWDETCRKGGLLFERCRIAALVPEPAGQLGKDIKRWADHVQKTRRRR